MSPRIRKRQEELIQNSNCNNSLKFFSLDLWPCILVGLECQSEDEWGEGKHLASLKKTRENLGDRGYNQHSVKQGGGEEGMSSEI